MHCPRCGQKQFSDDAHFCKSCGFPLDRVKELLVGGGVSPALEKENQKSGESPRRRGVRRGVALLFLCLALAPLTALIGRRGNFLPMMFLMAGLLRILYAIIFQEGARRKKKRGGSLPSAPITAEQFATATHGSALPPSRGVPVAAFYTQRVNTAQMVSPPSVTEHTTKLLKTS